MFPNICNKNQPEEALCTFNDCSRTHIAIIVLWSCHLFDISFHCDCGICLMARNVQIYALEENYCQNGKDFEDDYMQDMHIFNKLCK